MEVVRIQMNINKETAFAYLMSEFDLLAEVYEKQ